MAQAQEQLRLDQMLGVIKEFVQQEVPGALTALAVVRSRVVVTVMFRPSDDSPERQEYRITVERVA